MPPITTKMIDKISETSEDSKSPAKKKDRIKVGFHALKKQLSGESDKQKKKITA